MERRNAPSDLVSGVDHTASVSILDPNCLAIDSFNLVRQTTRGRRYRSHRELYHISSLVCSGSPCLQHILRAGTAHAPEGRGGRYTSHPISAGLTWVGSKSDTSRHANFGVCHSTSLSAVNNSTHWKLRRPWQSAFWLPSVG